MTSGTRTRAANEARRSSTRDKLERTEEALRLMRRERAFVTYPAVARRADVSRTFLYQNPDAKALMAAAIAAYGDQRRQRQGNQDFQVEAS
ncbi:DUF6262 family protein [Streptosporangium amethystogenes]|uniref:DUF6262 family protein n=1 Tax=Streptosporangium amethystogenes TaxID=2002 RepID=UPI0005616FAC|nr:DUF6262 family protein [Streptosporangium amethystogenes]